MVPLWIATLPSGPGPVLGAGIERAGEDPGQWATARASVGVEGPGWSAAATLPAAAVVDPEGVRAGLGSPTATVRLGKTLAVGLDAALPAGTSDVSQRAWGLTPWVGGSVSAGALQVGAQAGWTWAPGADPVSLPAADPGVLAHGALVPVEGAAPPPEHRHADPIHGREVHARVWAGHGDSTLAAAIVDLRHAPAATTLEAGVALAGNAARPVRPILLVAAPIASTAASGLHVDLAVEVRPR